jgi:hypothetical protein
MQVSAQPKQKTLKKVSVMEQSNSSNEHVGYRMSNASMCALSRFSPLSLTKERTPIGPSFRRYLECINSLASEHQNHAWHKNQVIGSS